ncbi:syntaxin 8 [Kwoniella heveanensis BCC8398]|uniref:Syntaxin 8 n=1 Tax=Kwoniella heveanensis BCC8398 TaxID=1296120 RepID=A0A1B9H4K4_9TREE|nr:syntaxin 8 [Kwoniella heveanensis BCC8398]
MSTTPTAASISSRLTTTSSLLLERSRIISLNLKPSPSSTSQIIRNLTSIKRDLDALETKDDDLHGGGSGKGKGVAGGGDGSSLGELGESYDRLLEMLSEDDVGREKVKTLQREKLQPTPSPAATAEVPPKSKSPLPRIHTPSSAEVPKLSVEPPTPGAGVTRFRDFPDSDDEANEIGLIGGGGAGGGAGRGSYEYDEDQDERGESKGGARGSSAVANPNSFKAYRDESDDEEGNEGGRAPSPHEMLSGQQAMMDDQDERLNLLSHSIGRQNHLSIQIGSELDLHHQLLEDTDAAMDRTAASLGRARRRLDRVAEDAKQHGSTITIVLLIFILLVLIIVFKT